MLNKIFICGFVIVSSLCSISETMAFDDPCDQPLEFCPEDVDLNGEITIDDVLQVLLNWIDCGDGTYRPIGDVNGDCCVDILDILQIIDRWDSDCIPKGACCLDDGAGCFEETAEDEVKEVYQEIEVCYIALARYFLFIFVSLYE